MKRVRNQLIISFLICLSYLGSAQVLPVNVTTLLQPPYSLYLEDYYAPGGNKLTANILFNDFNEPSWNVRLKITIESDRIRLQTRPDFVAPPITVVPGVMTTISGSDLEPYLDYDHLFITGASDLLKQSGRLPEGMYKFCIEVLDYESGAALSYSSCATVWLSLLDPPRIISPICGQYIPPSNPQNIIFQWHLTGVSPNLSMGVEYKIFMHEVIDITTDPRSAINNGKTIPVYESDWVINTQFLYDMSAPMLDVGKIYVYYTQVRDVGGRDLFKNGGASEICWFYYGYPENARLHLTDPVNDYKFARLEKGNFSWTAPNVRISNQPFEYYFKIVKLLDGQDSVSAIENNPPWFESTSPIRKSWTGDYIKPPKELEPSVKYVWQVTCFSGLQKVAVSEIFVFTGPPLIDRLFAGDHVVTVTSTTNADLNDLTGTGKIHIGKGDSVPVHFEHIKVRTRGDDFFLEEGELHHKFESPKEIALPARIAENKDAYFYAEKLKLDKEELQFYGQVKWPLPHPVQAAEKAYVVANSEWYNFDKFLINGRGNLTKKNKFDLLEPLGFHLHLNSESYFLVTDGRYHVYLQGNVLLPEKVEGEKSGRISFDFSETQQIYYITQSDYQVDNRFKLVENTGLLMSPTTYVLDLSEKESPGKFSKELSWKGIYFTNYEVHFLKNLDKFNQIDFLSDAKLDLELTSGNTHKNWVDHDGLDFYLIKDLSFSSTTFNTFPAKQRKIQLKLENNGVGDSWLKGDIKIPLISETEDFGYTLPITERGFSTGYLDKELNGRKFTFNKDGGDQKMYITIQRAVFSNQEKLNMLVDMDWPHLGASIKNVKGFSVWGDYNIGFNKPNGSVHVDKQVKASVNGYPVTLDILGGGRQSDLYSIGATGQIVMGEDIAGPDGATEVNLYSVNRNPLLDPNVGVGASINFSASGNGVSVSKDDMKVAAEQKLNAAFSANGEVLNASTDFQANLKFEVGDVDFNPEANFDVNFNTEFSLDGQLPSFSLEALQSLMTELSLQLPEEKRNEAMQVIQFLPKLDTDIQMRVFAELTDMKTLAIKMLKIKLEALIAEMLEPITLEVKRLEGEIKAKVDGVIADVNVEIKAKVKLLVDEIATGVIQLAASQNFDISAEIEPLKASITASLSDEITVALSSAIHANITGKFSEIINEKLIGGLRAHFVGKLSEMGMGILDGKFAGPKMDNMMSGIDGIFVNIGKDIIASLDINNLKGSFLGIGNDLIKKINVESIFERMVNELIVTAGQKLVTGYVTEFAAELAGELGGEFLGVLADNVPLDFTNLKGKLIDGDIGSIIKFDPTNIKIVTAIAIVQGTIHFKNDDPLWGDAWGGELQAAVTIQPKFDASARFMNGRKDGMGFWFFDVEVKNLNIVMAPTPFTFDGAVGRIYHHMQVTNTGVYNISKNVEYGGNLQFNFYDTPLQGSIIRFDVGAKVEIIPGGFYIGMLGNAKVGNAGGFSLATGKGEISYNSAEKHFIGMFDVAINTSPLLCAGGRMGIDVNPKFWMICVGTREDPIHVRPLCTGGINGWFVINKRGLDLGLNISAHFRIASPWISFAIIDVKPFAEAGFEFDAQAVLDWDPFGVRHAHVKLEMYAGIGVEYDWPWPGGDGTWYLARVALGGEVGFQTIERTKIWGKMHGEVEVVGIEVGFAMNVDHTF